MDMQKLNLKTIGQRLKSETPIFWKKVRTLMIVLGTISGSIQAAVSLNTVTLPAWLPSDYLSTCIIIGIIGTTLASLTVEKKAEPATSESN